MKIIVMGAGVIGVTTAYFLAKAGHKVIVLEKNKFPAKGCSYANGGQLSYCHVETWASKTSLFGLIKALIFPGSFLSAPNFFDKSFLKWLILFIRNSFSKTAKKNSKNLFKLALHSRKTLELMAKEEGIKFGIKEGGTLHFFRSKKLFNRAIKELDKYDFLKTYAKVISPKECVDKEPTLGKLLDKEVLAGGIFYEIDRSGNCNLFVKALEKICQEKYGVVFQYDVEIKNILTNFKKITGINTSNGVYTANKYVYALGGYGDKLLKGINVDTKIYPIKGYSITIPCNDEEYLAPKIALTDTQNKIVYSRLGNSFRAAGTVEISPINSQKNYKKIDFLEKLTKNSFSDCGNINKLSNWQGFRPFRPSSIPLVCEVKKYGNLLINAGHGSLGWTMSAGSAKILSEIVDGQKGDDFNFLEEEF